MQINVNARQNEGFINAHSHDISVLSKMHRLKWQPIQTVMKREEKKCTSGSGGEWETLSRSEGKLSFTTFASVIR